jgi:predicted dehydrogenase
MSKPIEAILIGAGERGANSYGPYALTYPEQIKFVAVAEPNPVRRAGFARQHNLSSENIFETWEPLMARPQFAQAVLVCTQDQQHTGPGLAALRAGYDVLLEKPMATGAAECRSLVETAQRKGRKLHVCHVLRYTPHFKKMREILDSGLVGQIIQVAHRENVSWWHMSHSYVRGNWANEASSSPMILAKCCHDFDLLFWLFGPCEQLSSVGNLLHYKPENAPEGAPQYCLDGCPAAQECPYYAPFIYLGIRPMLRSYSASASGLNRLVINTYLRSPALTKAASLVAPQLRLLTQHRGWPVSVVAADPTPENVLEALKRGPYGRCVYHCDNDVVDHQVVIMKFERGISGTLTMHGHSHEEGRFTQVEGARGTLRAHLGLGGSWIEVAEHRSGQRTRYNTTASQNTGHGGGDFGLMAAFVSSLRGEEAAELTTAEGALESHLLAFAAEQARLEGRVIKRDEFSSI